jgi:hypothetical protein
VLWLIGVTGVRVDHLGVASHCLHRGLVSCGRTSHNVRASCLSCVRSAPRGGSRQVSRACTPAHFLKLNHRGAKVKRNPPKTLAGRAFPRIACVLQARLERCLVAKPRDSTRPRRQRRREPRPEICTRPPSEMRAGVPSLRASRTPPQKIQIAGVKRGRAGTPKRSMHASRGRNSKSAPAIRGRREPQKAMHA